MSLWEVPVSHELLYCSGKEMIKLAKILKTEEGNTFQYFVFYCSYLQYLLAVWKIDYTLEYLMHLIPLDVSLKGSVTLAYYAFHWQEMVILCYGDGECFAVNDTNASTE